MPLRRLTKFSRLELEKREGRAASRRSTSSTRSSTTSSCCGRWSPTSSPRSPRPTAPRAAPCCSSRPARPSTAAVAARGRRRPVLRLPLLAAACWPAPATPSRRATAAAAPSTTWSSPRCATTARGQVGALTTPGRLVRLDVLDLPTLPATANAPAPAGRRAGQRVPLPRAGRAGARADLAGRRLRPGSRSAPAQGVVKRVNPEVLGNRDAWEVIRLADGDEVVGAVELRTGDEELLLRHLRRPAAALPGRRRSARRAGPAAASPASGSPPAQRVVFFGAFDARRRRGRGHRLRARHRAAGHRAGRGQGHPVRGVPRQGPRPPAASAATGSSRARTPWCSPGPGPGPAAGGRVERRAGRPARRPTAAATAPACPAPSRSLAVRPVGALLRLTP